MKAEDIEVGKFYEARVPIEGSRRVKQEFNTVLVVGGGDSYEHGNAQMFAVVYKAPLSPRGRGIALVSAGRIRLRRGILPIENASVASAEQP